ncbi:hypothetical protein [Methylomagnum sp.]
MLEVLLRYYVQSSKRLDEADIRELIETKLRGDDDMQTFIDRHIEQGKQQGVLLGRREGERKGRHKERVGMPSHLMTRKFGPPSPEMRKRVAKADEDTLLRWADQVLFADMADEALR